MSQNRSQAVMAQRREPPDSLDFFPTPPWATRAFLKFVLPMVEADQTSLTPPPKRIEEMTCWEPACGQGHMAGILREQFAYVFASDIFDYGYGEQLDFTRGEFSSPAIELDWIVTNAPFIAALEFAQRAIPIARRGVALLLRTVWLEGGEISGRFGFFEKLPPTHVFIFSERVPMVKGRWAINAKSATSYSWFVWRHPIGDTSKLRWIPPTCKARLIRQADFETYHACSDLPIEMQRKVDAYQAELRRAA